MNCFDRCNWVPAVGWVTGCPLSCHANIDMWHKQSWSRFVWNSDQHSWCLCA